MTGDKPTVLIVDDEEDVVSVYALAFDEGYEVRKAYDGEEALDVIDATVDVVLLDRRMPGMSGGEVLERIRGRAFDVRVAMVTAVDPDFDIADMSFDAYLTKPVGDETLRNTVDELYALAEYDDDVRERFALAEKKVALEAEKTGRELAESDEYQALLEREAELDTETVEQIREMDEETFGKALSRPSDDS